jgi:hypothetical protein
MLSCLVVSYTQRPSGFKAIIKSIFKIKLHFVNVGSLLLADSFALSFFRGSFWNLQNLAKMRAKMKYICKKFINHQIKKCLLFRCRHAVVNQRVKTQSIQRRNSRRFLCSLCPLATSFSRAWQIALVSSFPRAWQIAQLKVVSKYYLQIICKMLCWTGWDQWVVTISPLLPNA